MKVAPVTEDDNLSKAPLFSKYMETLPRALDRWEQTGLSMLMHLLEGVRKVVQHNTALHQELFRSAGLDCTVGNTPRHVKKVVQHNIALHQELFRSASRDYIVGNTFHDVHVIV